MTPSELDQILDRKPDPFSDAVLSNAYRDTPDVPEIHAHARARLKGLIDACRKEGTAHIQVITGDPGEGKTHLLAWLRRASEESWRSPEDKFALAPIAPLRAAERPFHHFLQEAVEHLGRTLPQSVHTDAATDSPLEIFLWRVMLNIVRLLAKAGWVRDPLATWLQQHGKTPDKYLTTFAAAASEGWQEIEDAFADAALRLRELGGVDREIFRALARFPREDARPTVIDWLSGTSIPPERASLLGTTMTLEGEAEAFRGLRTLLQLACVARVPMVLAFDQIEGTERLGEGAVADFFNALGEVFNAGGAAVLLIFCQTQIWPSLRRSAEQQVRDRLEETPPLALRALTPEEGFALVERRMKHFWKGTGAAPTTPLYPFSRDLVIEELRTGSLRTPRRILTHFRGLLADPDVRARARGASTSAPSARKPEPRRPPTLPPPPPPQEIVRRKLRNLLDEEMQRPPRAPEARADIALGMLREALKAAASAGRTIEGIKVAGVGDVRLRNRSASAVQAVLERGGDRRRVYVEANNSTHGQSVAAAAKRMRDVLGEKVADRVLLVRESSFALPPAARDHLAELTPRGAVVWLREDEIAPLAALEGLLNAADAGDIAVAQAEARELALEELASHLGIIARAVSAAYADATPARGADADVLLPARVRSHLRERCAMLPIPRLADALSAPIEQVHAAVEVLRGEGAVNVLLDRGRVPIVLLHPATLHARSGAPGEAGTPPESTVRRAQSRAGGRPR